MEVRLEGMLSCPLATHKRFPAMGTRLRQADDSRDTKATI